MSAGSSVTPGGYTSGDVAGQFTLCDERSLRDVMADILRQGYIPSFCTACYRQGRTGESFMELSKSGCIHNFCDPNALLTLEEWTLDYGDEEINALAKGVIETNADDNTKKMLARIDGGERDLYI